MVPAAPSGALKDDRWYVADFETKGEEYYEKTGKTEVWLWAVCDSHAVVLARGRDLYSFMLWCRRLRHGTVYFHNLKFDGTFLIDWLIKAGYPWLDTLKGANRGFTTLIGDMGEFYSISVQFSSKRRIEFLDSLKLMPFKVRQLGDAYGLDTNKGELDYRDYRMTKQAVDYIDRDVRVVALAMRHMKEEGIGKTTIASSAYSAYLGGMSKQTFEELNPDLGLEFLNEWREAYRGGRCQLNPSMRMERLEGVRRYDINSMYPYVMAYMPLPYGEGWKVGKPVEAPLFGLYHIRASFNLKPGHLPSLMDKGSFMGAEETYYIRSEGLIDLWISSVDYDLFRKHYDVFEERWIEGWAFATSTLQFKGYIDHWYNIKQNETGAKRTMAKLMLNSLYGKFGSNAVRQSKRPVLKEGRVAFEAGPEKEGKHYYLPKAIAITSWAHKLLDDAISHAGTDRFVYCDTDSVHMLGELPPEMVDAREIGKFKLEAVEEESKYVRQKTYLTKEEGRWKITCAGMPEEAKAELIAKYGDGIMDAFRPGLEAHGKLVPKRVPGGVVLHETTFLIKMP